MKVQVTAAFPLLLGALLPAQDPAQKLDLKVLYAGIPDHARTAEWREFLQPRTAGFDVIATEKVTKDSAAGFDVVIVDCPDPLVRNEAGQVQRISTPPAPGIGVEFGKPTIFVGGVMLVPDRLNLKIGWL